MKYFWWKVRNYIWTEYRMNMVAVALFLTIGGCYTVANYGILEGEIRLSRGKEIGEYLGGF